VDDSGLDTINWYINGTKGLIKPCGSDYIPAPLYGWANNQTYERFPIKERFMIKDPNPECIHNGNTLGVTMICVIVFSLFVQMAEGLHFGVVPYVSRPALGVVSGMVGAGGNFGGYYSSQWIIKAGAPIDKGFIYLGIVIMTVSCIMHFLFFPGEGGILIPKNFPYDPQWIKPPSDAKGSDELNFDAVDVKGSPRSGTKDNDSA